MLYPKCDPKYDLKRDPKHDPQHDPIHDPFRDPFRDPSRLQLKYTEFNNIIDAIYYILLLLPYSIQRNKFC